MNINNTNQTGPYTDEKEEVTNYRSIRLVEPAIIFKATSKILTPILNPRIPIPLKNPPLLSYWESLNEFSNL